MTISAFPFLDGRSAIEGPILRPQERRGARRRTSGLPVRHRGRRRASYAGLVRRRDGECSVTGCSRPTEGVLTLDVPSGGFRVTTCGEHGDRASSGETFVFDVAGSRLALGGGTAPSVRYDVLGR